jgi:hypothetical protein
LFDELDTEQAIEALERLVRRRAQDRGDSLGLADRVKVLP